MVSLPEQAQRLCIYTGENDTHAGRPLYEVIVEMARKRGLAGATVTRGVSGFGANSLVHTIKVLRLSEDLPLLIQIVDTPEKIEAFLPELDAVISEGLVTVEPVQVVFYRHKNGKKNQ
ncbi:DUF190 domain-containing protein [Desulfovibrio subterraneus]|jgi:PII-like signaling protein|uniref:Uncharacterized protein n=1 Tax=Desulfovibrio subterraneus TaxID=2718620 RepID=A0A7J0BLT8_9BACT|nr:DUF190 domain-containing protein [Desulfovibrio subterraneus]WBF68191.1 DUF190 domain-containing protein [Desulfovibrio subterraneus]GFM34135.1 hypothetical protein DSM101010T_25000 [Desulfovibrio subterraneus]